MINILKEAEAMSDDTIKWRRDFHQHPELGFKEQRTSTELSNQLKKLEWEVHTGIAETGIVALLYGKRQNPLILLRFDMDALPIQEENIVAYSSLNPGVMHACGHDGHMAIGLTAASLLAKHRSNLSGSVMIVFQPAEEGDGGAERMLSEGILEKWKPDCCLAIHLWNEKEVGWLSLTPGALMAGSDHLQIEISGVGGHGAAPQQTADPIIAAAQVILAIQSIVSRNISPLESAVISVTSIHAGTANNVIPSNVGIGGTIRSYDPIVRDKIIQRVQEISSGISTALGCSADVKVKRITPPVINDENMVSLLTKLIRKIYPDYKIIDNYHTMISEDMAYFQDQVPGCHILLGSANFEKGYCFGHHHPKFDFDEMVLPRASALLVSSVFEIIDHLLKNPDNALKDMTHKNSPV